MLTTNDKTGYKITYRSKVVYTLWYFLKAIGERKQNREHTCMYTLIEYGFAKEFKRVSQKFCKILVVCRMD